MRRWVLGGVYRVSVRYGRIGGRKDGYTGGVKVCKVFDSIEPEAQRARR